MQKKKGLPFLLTIIMLGVLPLMVAAVSLTLIARNSLSSELETSVYDRLKVAAEGLDEYYAWDIINTGEAAYEHEYVDHLLGEGIELTLFLEDVRYITSIKDAKNESGRNEGTKAAADIWATVKAGNDYKSDGVVIDGNEYYVYYTPMKDASDTVVGMAFAGELEESVHKATASATTFLVIVAVALAAVCAVIVVVVAIIIKRPIGKVSASMDVLAGGNLGEDIEINSGIKEINALIGSAQSLQSGLRDIISTVNAKADILNGNVEEITENVVTCNQATDGIVSAVDELAKGSMEMAESVQNTAASMQEIGNGINSITDLATEANKTANEVKSISHEAKGNLENLMTANGDTVVISKNVVEGILDASAAVEEIRRAADVIADIASQTNLLSLNASIEAARAGEAGRGFAVVAGEISSLAAQSDASTKEIKGVIENIITKTENSVKLANQIQDAIDNEGKVLAAVSDSFDAVDTRIEITADAINSIAASTDKLNTDKNNVLDEVSTLSSISEENAASCEETTSSMQELGANMTNISAMAEETRTASDELKEAVSYFKL